MEDDETTQKVYQKNRANRLEIFNALPRKAAKSFAAAKKRKLNPGCDSTPESSDCSGDETEEECNNESDGVGISLVPNTSKYGKTEALRVEIGTIGQSVAQLEAKHQDAGQMVDHAEKAFVSEEKEFRRLETELEKAKTRYEEAKQAPRKIEAERLQTGHELKRKRDLLVMRQGMLDDYEEWVRRGLS